jgi:subfamily B ATP-binding cassette protein MsbA
MYTELLKVSFPYLKKYKKIAIGAFVLSFLLALVPALQLKLIQPIIDKAFNPNTSWSEIIWLGSLLLILQIINFPIRFFHFYWLKYINEQMNNDVRSKLFSKLQNLPTNYYNHNKQGKMLSSVINDAEIFAQSYRAVIDSLREPIKAIGYLIVAITCDWQLTVIIFIVSPLFVVIFQKSGKKIKHEQGFVQHERAELTHTINEGLSAHKITKAFNLQNYVLGRFQFSQNRYFNHMMKTAKLEEIAHPLVELIGGIAFALIVVFAFHRAKHGLTPGAFMQFIGAMAMFMDPIRKFSQANVKMSQGMSAYNRLKSVLELEEEVDRGNLEKKHFENAIEISHLSFSYGDHQVIKDLNLTIKKGQKVALVGLSGSGKSTLINLLLRLYPVSSGQIKIDNNPIENIKLRSLRSLFGLVSQDIFLFNDSIKENISIGKDFSEAEINKALEVSYASEFVNRLPQKLETVIGDRGAKLSGGQQQRLTIARAFLQNTEILLFDEATSALDNESEKVVQKALESISGNKTVIAVAHRLSTIQDYDQIFVMKEGMLVESGTHHELMANASEYKKLYELSLKA